MGSGWINKTHEKVRKLFVTAFPNVPVPGEEGKK